MDEKGIPKDKRPPKFAIKLAKRAWRKKWSPFGVMRSSGRGLVDRALSSYMRRRMKTFTGPEAEALKRYFHQTLLRDGSTEYAVFVCFKFGMKAKHALEEEDRLGKVEVPVVFVYGDHDWMYDAEGSTRLV